MEVTPPWRTRGKMCYVGGYLQRLVLSAWYAWCCASHGGFSGTVNGAGSTCFPLGSGRLVLFPTLVMPTIVQHSKNGAVLELDLLCLVLYLRVSIHVFAFAVAGNSFPPRLEHALCVKRRQG